MRTSLAAAMATAATAAAALGSLAFASGAGDAEPARAEPARTEPARTEPARTLLPAPVTVTAGTHTYRITSGGTVRRAQATPLPFPAGADWFPATGSWFMIRHRHLVVGQWGRRLWRSRGQFPSRFALDVVTVNESTIAFAYGVGAGQRLYVAHTDGPERLAAYGEFPLGWTSRGFYTYRFRGRQLRLRADTGALREIIAADPLEYAYDESSRSLYFVANDAIMRADGTGTRQLAALSHLGLVANSSLSLQPLTHGLLELLQDRRLIVLNANTGSVFAKTQLTRDRSGIEAPDSPLAVSPDGREVAFSLPDQLEAASPDPVRGAVDLETVYLLPAGAHTATGVHTEQVQFAPCISGANVEWHGHWLLWSAGEGISL